MCRLICRKVLFIATANTMDPVPGPLRDRMEVIEIPGYTNSDKLDIATRYLVPRQLEANGVPAEAGEVSGPGAELDHRGIHARGGGAESGASDWQRCARSIAAEIVDGKTEKVTVTRDTVTKVLGPRKFDPELASRTSVPGVATGMAYTPVGGEILFIEARACRARG